MPTITTFGLGDLVRVRPEYAKTAAHRTDTYKVIKVNPKTLKLENTSTKATLVAHPEVLMDATEAIHPSGATLLPAYSSPLVGPAPDFETFDKGTVVTLAGKDGYFVVTGDTDKGYRLFPLGGSSRYYTGVNIRHLTRVTEISNWKAGN